MMEEEEKFFDARSESSPTSIESVNEWENDSVSVSVPEPTFNEDLSALQAAAVLPQVVTAQPDMPCSEGHSMDSLNDNELCALSFSSSSSPRQDNFQRYTTRDFDDSPVMSVDPATTTHIHPLEPLTIQDMHISSPMAIKDDGKQDVKSSTSCSTRSSPTFSQTQQQQAQLNVPPLLNIPLSPTYNTTSPKLSHSIVPRNAVPIKSIRKFPISSEFHPLLMIRSVTKAHTGPIWTCAFSVDGKYFCTGGKDAKILLWTMSGTSKPQHYERTSTASSIDSNRSALLPTPPPNTFQTQAPPMGIEVPILSQDPLIFYGHTLDVVDLSWSTSNYLLSASTDKTIRLWHPSQTICLKTFYVSEIVTSVCFHPMDDRYFLSAGFDRKCSIWSIVQESMIEWAQAPTFVSAARITPDAKYIVAGLVNGMVIIYSLSTTLATTGVVVGPSPMGNRTRLRTDSISSATPLHSPDLQFSIRFYTQISCKKTRAKVGKKVTGFAFLQNLSVDKVLLDTKVSTPTRRTTRREDDDSNVNDKSLLRHTIRDHLKSFTNSYGVHGFHLRTKLHKVKQKLLVTTNDSVIRLIGLDDFCTVRQYKGSMINNSLQIQARFSESGEYIVCGSENGTCTIWNTATMRNPLKIVVSGLTNYDTIKAHECFEASKADPPIVTDTIFVPSRTMKEALRSTHFFQSMDYVNNVNYDMSSAAIITCDYEGTVRVFLRKSCLDAVLNAANDPIV